MAFLLLFGVAVVLISAWTVWSRVGGEPRAVRPWRRATDRSSVEGVLAAQLAAGDITHRQYTEAMTELALHDEPLHPLTVPGDPD